MDDDKTNEEIIYGKNAVLAYLQIGTQANISRVNKIFISDSVRVDARIQEVRRLAQQQHIAISEVRKEQIARLVGTDVGHQGVLASISQADQMLLSDFLPSLLSISDEDYKSFKGKVSNTLPALLAISDGIEDPHNLGAIIRVAEAAGVRALLLPSRRSAGLTGAVAKASAGAIARLPIVRIKNVVEAIEQLKKAGFWIAGLAADAELSYFQADLVRPLAVVIGNEGKGIGRLVSKHCDLLLRIPMLGQAESLNASVAAGLVFYEYMRQNQP